ncbi:hypothetical protein EYV94_05065 [Puteibacter caeruleilacunae]|nr:hypothetical protein EYV94_05065 [Puteibacter caeruleilacunae]
MSCNIRTSIINLVLFILVGCFSYSVRADSKKKEIDIPANAIIFSTRGTKVVDLPDWTTINNAKISIWNINNKPNQHWNFERYKKGYVIRSAYSKQVLAANMTDSTVIQQSYDQSSYQYWTLKKENDVVKIINKASELCLDIEEIKKGERLVLRSNKDVKTQNWRLVDSRNNIASIVYGSYLNILKQADQYNKKVSTNAPGFSYQESSNENLIRLKNTFKLDSIAGSGDDVKKVLNVMHWLHDKVKHDGQHGNPPKRNAIDMINACEGGTRGLNCRGLAMALNECYLSLGFKSRYVTCLPKDPLKIDQDCHVINMVFIDSLNKWIWVDPSFDAYVMDEHDNLLGIEEVRQRLINDLPLKINDYANWNHKKKTVVEKYLYDYMAKNLYCLECPVISRFDNETIAKGKVIEMVSLLPVNHHEELPEKSESKRGRKGSRYITYRTNNPEVFWTEPGVNSL